LADPTHRADPAAAGRAAAGAWHSSLRAYEARGQQAQQPAGEGLVALFLGGNQVGPAAARARLLPAQPVHWPQGAAPLAAAAPLAPAAGCCGAAAQRGTPPGPAQITAAGASALQQALAVEHLQLALLDLKGNCIAGAPQLEPAFEAAMRQAGMPAVVDLRNQQQQPGSLGLLLCTKAAASSPLLLKLGIDVEVFVRPPAAPGPAAKAGSRPRSASGAAAVAGNGGSSGSSQARSYSQMGNRLLQQALQRTAAAKQQPPAPKRQPDAQPRSASASPPLIRAGSELG
jgi:hypothetical protein